MHVRTLLQYRETKVRREVFTKDTQSYFTGRSSKASNRKTADLYPNCSGGTSGVEGQIWRKGVDGSTWTSRCMNWITQEAEAASKTHCILKISNCWLQGMKSGESDRYKS